MICFRKIEPNEVERALWISAHAFHGDLTPESIEKTTDSLEQEFISIYGAYTEDGLMVACATVFHFDIWFNGKIEKSAGIGSVSSLPQYRRGGNIRGIFRAIFQDCLEQGVNFSYLYPFSAAYYRKFGYEYAAFKQHITFTLSSLLAIKGYSGHGEEFIPDESDPEPIIDIYNTFAQRYDFMLDRDAPLWQKILEIDSFGKKTFTYVWYNECEEPCAYFQYRAQPVGNFTNDMVVTQIAWTDHKALMGLLGFMGNFHGNLIHVIMDVPLDFCPELFLSEIQTADIILQSRGMNRIVNARGALEAMSKPSESGSVVIEITDSMISENQNTFQVMWDDTGTTVSVAEDKADMTCDISSLSLLLTSRYPFELLAGCENITVHTKADLLSKLFGGKNCCISDHF